MTLKYALILAAFTFVLGFFLGKSHDTQDQLTETEQGLPPIHNEITQQEPPKTISPQTIEPITQNNEPVFVEKEKTPIEKVQALITKKEYTSAIQLLHSILQKNPADAEALLLLARLFEQQVQHQDAVSTWFRYLTIETDAKKIEDALSYLANYLLRLANNPMIFGEHREWLATQLNDLTKLTPDAGELHLQLAEIYAEKEDTEQVQYHALMAANQTETRSRAEALLARLTENTLNIDKDEIRISLTRFGNQFLVPVSVDGQNLNLLLDTGASISGLTDNFIRQHPGMVKAPKPIQLNTASGTINSFLFVVESFNLDSITFNKHMLANLPMGNVEHFDGLLGVDILGKFDFVIDQNNAVLRLRKRQ
jgi:tetratricopeptide (TPR) repeat protein